MIKLFLVQISTEMSDQSPVFSIKVGFSDLFQLQQKKLIMQSVIFPETGVALSTGKARSDVTVIVFM